VVDRKDTASSDVKCSGGCVVAIESKDEKCIELEGAVEEKESRKGFVVRSTVDE